ncbi:alpha-1,3-fucosyltransferase 10, glycosyltransferase family 10 protein [Rhodotorula toruloides]|uniref:Fucosyltransferase n=1 Tax=Rhodotorula toruloides TaxID=5286 RepID=A0A511KGV2_RHOTO|nr:alpha-1,3-fucosyltransferase 10, glycosyltransferase family 10 protein [Rhodotorula toruloides]
MSARQPEAVELTTFSECDLEANELEGVEEELAAVEEELAWQRKPQRRRLDWRTGILGVVAGCLFGYLATRSAGSVRATTSSNEAMLVEDDNLTGNITGPAVRLHYRHDDKINQGDPILQPDCPVAVVYTEDESAADVLVLNVDSHAGLEDEELERLRNERPWQKFAAWGVESAPNRPFLERHFNSLREGKRNETYDFEITYRLNSTVPATYSYAYFNYSNVPLLVDQKRSYKIAAAFITNCQPKNARSLVLDELISLLPGKVDSFGSCHNNADIDATLQELGIYDDVGQHTKWNEKITLISRYRFTVAFENSNDLDYATEKYFQALERGSVPLVYGPPEAASRFFPSPTAAIDLADYLPSEYTSQSTTDSKEPKELSLEAKAGIKRLAERLEYLSSETGRAEYEEMLAWKKDTAWLEDAENPLGKVVRQANSPYPQDCRLAGAFLGEAWARNTWVPP